jgi:hypothetical protein
VGRQKSREGITQDWPIMTVKAPTASAPSSDAPEPDAPAPTPSPAPEKVNVHAISGVSRRAAGMIEDIFSALTNDAESKNAFMNREQYGRYLRTLKFWDGCDEQKWVEQCENIDANPVEGIPRASFTLLYTRWRRPLPADHAVVMADVAACPEALRLRPAALRAVSAAAAGRKHYTSWDFCEVCGDDARSPENPMVFCSECDVAVHPQCYGAPLVRGAGLGLGLGDGSSGARSSHASRNPGSPTQDGSPGAAFPTQDPPTQDPPSPLRARVPLNWRCDRCLWGAQAAKCVLCPVAEGAMKRTTDGRWMHISCGLWVPEVFFLNGEAREPIDYFQVPESRFERTCEYCGQGGPDAGACLPCSWPGCGNAFHVRCGLHHGRTGVAPAIADLEEDASVEAVAEHVRLTELAGKPRIFLQLTPGRKEGDPDVIVGYCSQHARRAKRSEKGDRERRKRAGGGRGRRRKRGRKRAGRGPRAAGAGAGARGAPAGAAAGSAERGAENVPPQA